MDVLLSTINVKQGKYLAKEIITDTKLCMNNLDTST